MSLVAPTPAPGETFDPTQKPPPFGHPLKQYFALDHKYVNLNHGGPSTCLRISIAQSLISFAGSYGSLPLPVLYAANKLAYEVEFCPDRFHRLVYKPQLVNTR